MKKLGLIEFEKIAIERYRIAITQNRIGRDIVQDISECSEFLFKSICMREFGLEKNSYFLREPVAFLYKNHFFSKKNNSTLRYPALKHDIVYSDSESIRHRGNASRHETYKVTKEDIGAVIYAIKSILIWYFSEKYDYNQFELLPEQRKIIVDLFKLDLEEQVQKEKNKHFINEEGVIKFNKWNAKTNCSTPQWTDYFNIPVIGFLKRIKCQVISDSQYYRFGFKLFKIDGKLFGDGSIQSQDNNLVLHLGKNYLSDELFITTYSNGILDQRDKYVNINAVGEVLTIELFIDTENFLYFHLNGNEMFKKIINKEILGQIYLLAWGDGNEYQVNVENIEIEFDNK